MLFYLVCGLLQFKKHQLKSLAHVKTVWVHFPLKKNVGSTLNGNMREQKKSNKKMQVKQFRKYF